MTKNLFYNREKKIGIEFDNITQKIILIALSAKDKEMMIAQAQKNHANTVKQLSEAADSIRTIYLLENIKRLAEVMLAAEYENFVAKAILTLVEDEIDFREKMKTKVEIIGQIISAQVTDAPPREIIGDPQAFRNWVEHCKKVYETRTKY